MAPNKPLKVYVFEPGDGSCRLVAAPSKTRAARLLGISLPILTEHGRETFSEAEVERALSDPGAVWGNHEESPEWRKISSSRKANLMESHGGPRPGAGPKLQRTALMHPRSFRASDEDYAAYLRLGGVSLIRRAIDTDLALSEDDWTLFQQLGGGEWLRTQLARQAARRNGGTKR